MHRWRKARRWERMLDDPATAHLVPPLAAHLKSAPSAASGFALIGGCILSGTLAVGLITYGALALAGRVPAVDDAKGEDLSGSFVKWGALLLLFALFLAWRVRRWRVARRVEELSSDATLVPRHARPGRRGGAALGGDPRSRRRLRWRRARRRVGRSTGLDRSTSEPLHILYLRLFDNVAGTTRFTRSPWRRYGYIHLLRSAAQVEAEELEAAEDSGSVASLFISTPEQLDAALARQATGREDEPRPKGLIKSWRWTFDHDRGRYPVRALLCHGSFWKAAVDLLLARMDLVALDLAGYRPEHAGTRYELQRVIDRYPIDRVDPAGRSDERPTVPHRPGRGGVGADGRRITERRHRLTHHPRRGGHECREIENASDRAARHTELMSILIGTEQGLRALDDGADLLRDQPITAVSGQWALVGDRQLVSLESGRRDEAGGSAGWCVLDAGDRLYVGTAEARLFAGPSSTADLAPVESFDRIETRDEWYTPWGAPPDTRSLAAGPDGTLLVNVHVGGVWRGTADDGWTEVIDVDADTHQVVADVDRGSRRRGGCGRLRAQRRRWCHVGRGQPTACTPPTAGPSPSPVTRRSSPRRPVPDRARARSIGARCTTTARSRSAGRGCRSGSRSTSTPASWRPSGDEVVLGHRRRPGLPVRRMPARRGS